MKTSFYVGYLHHIFSYYHDLRVHHLDSVIIKLFKNQTEHFLLFFFKNRGH